MAKTNDDILVHRVKRNNNSSNTRKNINNTEAKRTSGKQHTADTKQKPKVDKQYVRNIKVLAGFLIVFALLLLLALVSYSPADSKIFLNIQFHDLLGLVKADQEIISQ